MAAPPSPALSRLGEQALRLARETTIGRLVLAHLHSVAGLGGADLAGDDALATALRAAVARAREPVPYARVERVLRGAWGAGPSRELDDLERDPAAVTPAAQVHRGWVEGTPVAVKVRRPGLATTVRSELGLLDVLAAPLGALLPAVDPRAVLREVRERLLDELDLEHEGATQRRFARALRRDPDVTVPSVIGRLTHEDVLVSDWVEGRPVRRLAGAPVAEREQTARRLVRFYAGAARFGVVHADPDPDDVLVLPEGRLAVLDFGAARPVAPDRVDRAAAALEALARGDARGLGAAAAGATWDAPADDHAALALAREALGPLIEGVARLDAAALEAAGERAERRGSELARLAARSALRPEDLWPLRSLAGLTALLARLDVRLDWLGLLARAARRGWT